jgi:hypothetical protein
MLVRSVLLRISHIKLFSTERSFAVVDSS